MDETNQALQFLSAFQRMALDPETLLLEGDALDHRFKSLVQKEIANEEENNRTKVASHRNTRSSVTFAAFRSGNDQRLTVCTPQENELLEGWQSRMGAINYLPDGVKIDQLIGVVARQQNTSLTAELGFDYYASVILGMSREALLQNHTLSPFFNALQGLKPNKAGNKSLKHRQAFERKAPFRLGGKFLHYCQQCAKEDLALFGYSYWRRDHQLPGMLWCSKHGHQLKSVRRRDAIEQCPHQITDSLVDNRVHSLTQVQTEVLKRYARISSEILSQASAIDSLAASAVLNHQAKTKNLRISKLGKRTTVSSELTRLLPIWWLNETSPRVQWVQDKYISTIDGACIPGTTRYTTTTLSLLAALFYEDQTQAISEILKPRERVVEKQRGFDYWASKDVFDEYIAQRGVVSRVAAQLSLPLSTVGVGLLNQGLPGLGKASLTIKAARAFLAGQSLAEACAESGTSTEELEELLRAGCSKLRNALDAIPDKITSYAQEPVSGNENLLQAAG